MFYNHNYRYIDPIKKPNGKLRDWEEYNLLTKIESQGDHTAFEWTVWEEREMFEKKHEIIDNEKR